MSKTEDPKTKYISMAEAAAMYLNGQITIEQWYNFGKDTSHSPKPQTNK